MNTKRIVFIDNLKCFAIICVMIGHALQYLFGESLDDLISFNLIYTFHMPLFMMISGYFAKSSFSLSVPEFFKKKSIQLLLPALAWSVVKIMLSGGDNVLNNLTGSFWFLKSAFICYLITYAALRFIKNDVLALITLFFAPFVVNLDLYTYMLNYMLPSFAFGIVLRNNIDKILEHKAIIGIISALIFVVLLPFWNFSEYHYSSVWQNGMFYLKNELICIHRVAIGLSGSLLLFILFSLVRNTTKVIQTIGASTLGLYVMNGLFTDVQRHLMHYTIDSELWCIIASILLVAIQLPLFLFVIKLMRNNKYLSMLFLGINK